MRLCPGQPLFEHDVRTGALVKGVAVLHVGNNDSAIGNLCLQAGYFFLNLRPLGLRIIRGQDVLADGGKISDRGGAAGQIIRGDAGYAAQAAVHSSFRQRDDNHFGVLDNGGKHIARLLIVLIGVYLNSQLAFFLGFGSYAVANGAGCNVHNVRTPDCNMCPQQSCR